MRARRGTLGYHELVTDPKYFVKWLVDDNKWRSVKHPYKRSYEATRATIAIFLQGRTVDALRESS